MGDVSAEPSMEEILSSIKRIIAEEGDSTPARQRRPRVTPAADPVPAFEADFDDAADVLELNQPIAERVAPRMSERERTTDVPPPAPTATAEPAAEPILSLQTQAASRGPLDALTRLVVKPEPGAGDNTLEGLVREMLRPILREWLDANLPDMVETMVAREIERITGQPR